MKLPHISSVLMIVIGLGFWSLAPYGGCACNNPLGPASGPTPTASPTQGPLLDDFEDGDFNSKWGVATSAVKDTYATTMTFSLANEGCSLVGGTPGRSVRVNGTIDREIGTPTNQYPYVQVSMPLGASRNMLTTFAAYNGVSFCYKWGRSPIAPGSSFFINAITATTVTDFGWWRYQVTPANNNWNYVSVYFPNKVPAPKFAQPVWAAARPWTTGVMSGAAVDRIDFAVAPSAAAPYIYDLLIDDVTFF